MWNSAIIIVFRCSIMTLKVVEIMRNMYLKLGFLNYVRRLMQKCSHTRIPAPSLFACLIWPSSHDTKLFQFHFLLLVNLGQPRTSSATLRIFYAKGSPIGLHIQKITKLTEQCHTVNFANFQLNTYKEY